jgi:hypothetical protein
VIPQTIPQAIPQVIPQVIPGATCQVMGCIARPAAVPASPSLDAGLAPTVAAGADRVLRPACR